MSVSVVVGEREISGQVRRAHADARAGTHLSPQLDRLFQSALRTSRAGVFAAGNVVHPVDTADVAALDGRHVADHVRREREDFVYEAARLMRDIGREAEQLLRLVRERRCALPFTAALVDAAFEEASREERLADRSGLARLLRAAAVSRLRESQVGPR